MTKNLAEKIDAILPQTQCQLCEFKGCKPYAEAIADGEAAIDRCLPGGVETLQQLGELTNTDPAPFIDEMQHKQRPAQVAIIREDECIGCTKCIQACPTDVIIGASKQMHSIILADCSGCELCIAPCPVDCIDLRPIPEPDTNEKQHNASKWRTLYHQKNQRLTEKKSRARNRHQQAKLATSQTSSQQTIEARKKLIQEAVMRAQQKRKER